MRDSIKSTQAEVLRRWNQVDPSRKPSASTSATNGTRLAPPANVKPIDAKDVFLDPIAAEVGRAVAAGDTARLQRWIEDGANPNAVGDKGTSLLQWAMLTQNKATFEALLAAGADAAHTDASGETVVHYAALARDPSYMDILLAHRVDPNTRNTTTGMTALMTALVVHREEQFRKLLAAGADPNLTDRMGNTALHFAAKVHDYERVLDLLEAGANPRAKNRQKVTFQRYLAMTPRETSTPEAHRLRSRITAWLRDHGVPLEDAKRKAN